MVSGEIASSKVISGIKTMNCKKCNCPGTVVLRQKDNYCNDCFLYNTNHKFRACIGKNKVLSPNENILICLSGGLGSTVLLDLVHYGISLDNTKKLRINPYFIHLYDDKHQDLTQSVLKQCQKYNFDIYMIHLANCLNAKINLPDANCVPDDKYGIKEFDEMLNSMPASAANDFLLKVKRNLFVKLAKQLKCTAIFTAETTTTLAINLLCNLAIGRGSQVQNDVGFSDNRDEEVKILRPIKDIGTEEMKYYVNIKQLAPVCRSNIKSNSLQSVISSFVSELQENFQATISTVCKTADKIGDYDTDKIPKICTICKSQLHIKHMKLSALEATTISRRVSFGNNHFGQDIENNPDFLKNLENDAGSSMFPLMHKFLCYGCSRNYSEMSQLKMKLPLYLHVQNIL